MGKPVSTNLESLLPIDAEHNARITIDTVHEKIHKGIHWNTSCYQAGSSAMDVLVTAPANAGVGHYHFIAQIATTGPGTATWSKSPNYDATGGTVLTAYNNNEDSSNVSTLVHVKGGSYTSSGTILSTFLIGNTTGSAGLPIRVGGADGHNQEWELGYSSVHLIRFVPSASYESVIRTYFYRKA